MKTIITNLDKLKMKNYYTQKLADAQTKLTIAMNISDASEILKAEKNIANYESLLAAENERMFNANQTKETNWGLSDE